MAFPTSPVDGQIYKDKKYNTALGVWKKNTESFTPVIPTIVPDFNNTALANNGADMFDASGKIPSDAIAIEMRVWLYSSAEGIYNFFEYGPADESIAGDGRHAAFGDSNVAANGFSHYTN